MKKYFLLFIASLAILAGCQNNTQTKSPAETALDAAKLYGDEKISSPYGTLELQNNYITDESSKKLFDALDLQRAAQAYIWSTPWVSMATWKIEQEKNYGGGKFGVFAVLVSFNEKVGILTPNLTTPYIFQFYNLTNGPVEIDYPVGATAGGLLDFWQRPIADLGLTGPDQGNGGKYIVIAPGDDLKKYEKKGVYAFQSPTNNILIALRILETDPEKANNIKKSLKMGIVGEDLQNCSFVENENKPWSGTAYRGLDYWKTLHQMIDEEPVREQDKVWMAMLEPLGIKKGEAFNPDERQTKILLEGAALGELMARNLQINPRYTEPYWPGTGWYKSFDFTIPQITDYKVELDERATWFYEAVGSSEGMINPEIGKGQVYMTTKRDSQGRLLRADKTYKLHIPNDVPVAQFWALTLYSENTRRPYENGSTELTSANLDSRMERLQYNEDGSVDLFIGAKSPAGKESNYMKTVGTDGWFVYFRLYGPLEAFFDKSFSLTDFVMID